MATYQAQSAEGEAPPPYTAVTEGASVPLVGTNKDRFQYETAKCNDKFWAVAFYIHLIVFIAMTIYYVTQPGALEIHTSVAANKDDLIKFSCAVFGVSLVCAAAWLYFIRACAKTLIWFSLGLSLVCWLAVAGAGMVMGETYMIIVGLLMAAIQALWMWCVRARIAFAAAVLTIAVQAANRVPTIYLTSFLSLFVQMGWVIVWVLGFTVAASCYSNDSKNCAGGMGGVLLFLMVVSLYWTGQVIANVVHVTAAGSVGTWYFLESDQGVRPPNPVLGAFKRAMGTSFGSIAFGSLLIAIIQAMRAMIHAARNNRNNFIRCCVECILRCIENILNYFNLYAFTHVAIYGDDFCTAARATWQLFQSKGFTMIINDDLIGHVLALACLFAGGMSFLISAVLAYYAFPSLKDDFLAYALEGFVVAFVLCLCVMVIVRSAVATIFVCFAEDPAALLNTKPAPYARLTHAWSARYGAMPAGAPAGPV